MVHIVVVEDAELLARTVALLRAFPPHQRRRYPAHLHIVPRSFDDAAYAREMEALGSLYGPPDGRILAALEDGQVIGAVCLRRLDDVTCEMKRLYVPPEHRRRAWHGRWYRACWMRRVNAATGSCAWIPAPS